ncbi:MAG: hypothetical protein WC732_08560 [Candidatus Omnitrophota bacterium]
MVIICPVCPDHPVHIAKYALGDREELTLHCKRCGWTKQYTLYGSGDRTLADYVKTYIRSDRSVSPTDIMD